MELSSKTGPGHHTRLWDHTMISTSVSGDKENASISVRIGASDCSSFGLAEECADSPSSLEAFVHKIKRCIDEQEQCWVNNNSDNDTCLATTGGNVNGVKKRKQERVMMIISSPVSKPKRKGLRRNPSTTGTNGTTTRRMSSRYVVYRDYCELPGTLGTVLADESKYITKKGLQNGSDCGTKTWPLRRLHNLPDALTVKHLLQHFEKKRRDDSCHHEHGNENTGNRRLEQFCDELAILFDKFLLTNLLYQEEIPQFESSPYFLCKHGNKSRGINSRPCEVYGCSFLLRLLVRLPDLLPHLEEEEPAGKHLLHTPAFLVDLIMLLQKNRQVCFRHSYREPTYEELVDWEKAVVDHPEFFGCSTVATDDDDDMAVTPKKTTRTIFPPS